VCWVGRVILTAAGGRRLPAGYQPARQTGYDANMTETTRQSLIIRLRNPRDSQAWEEFYTIYGPLVFRYARRKGLSHDDAEEIQSQIMAAVTQQIGTFEYDKARGGFKNWLRRITHNKIVDLWRRRREGEIDTQFLGGIPDDSPSPDEEWDREWQKAHIV